MSKSIRDLAKIPSLPTVAVQLLNMFSDKDVGIADVVFVLQNDPAIAGKILKAANTSRMGLRRPVSDLQRAVILLGKKSVMALALGFSLAEASMKKGPHARRFMDVWFQSLVRGCSGSLIAERFTRVESGEAFTMGLLGRIGRLALLSNDPEPFVACVEEAEQSGAGLDTVEDRELKITSRSVTAHLLKEWRLPAACLDAAQTLSEPFESFLENRDPERITLSDILLMANALAEFFSGENRGLAVAKMYELGSTIFNLSEEDVNQLVDDVRAELDTHSDLFSVDMSKVGEPMELLSQAMQQLAELAAAAVMPEEAQLEVPTEISEENSRLRKRVMELTESSMIDGLTDLYNRTYLMQQMQERVPKAARTESPIAVVFIDIDHFKKFNDTHGHLIGDEVLKAVAQCIKQTLREVDIVTRYGGEEFVVLASVPDRFGLERLSERIRERVGNRKVTTGGLDLQVTVSLGGAIAVPPPHHAGFIKEILEAADSALYRSKNNGRNRWTVTDQLSTAPNVPAAKLSPALQETPV